jgi:hypothetical protein
MYADALVILWRFQPEVESIKLFRECLLAERSDAVKICAVTAMHTLAREVCESVTVVDTADGAYVRHNNSRIISLRSHFGTKLPIGFALSSR